jgi:hypothetical protein
MSGIVSAGAIKIKILPENEFFKIKQIAAVGVRTYEIYA